MTRTSEGPGLGRKIGHRVTNRASPPGLFVQVFQLTACALGHDAEAMTHGPIIACWEGRCF